MNNVLIPKLSKASKMPCKSFSLPVSDEVCKGMKDSKGNIKPVCVGCYAKKGFYNMPVVKALREHNYKASKAVTWSNKMIDLVSKELYFRWFDSGDIYSDRFLNDIYIVCRNTPSTKHWIPTKARELFNQDTWKALEALPNVTVRYSSPSIIGTYSVNHRSTVVQALHKSTKDLFYCPASKQEGKCKNCRACWNDNIKVVAYLKH